MTDPKDLALGINTKIIDLNKKLKTMGLPGLSLIEIDNLNDYELLMIIQLKKQIIDEMFQIVLETDPNFKL